MISSGLRWIYSIAFVSLFLFCNASLHAQSVDMADLGSLSESIYKVSNQKVYGMRISATGTATTLTQLTSQTTGGNYTATDISNFSLYYNTQNDFSSATLIGTSGASTGAGEVITFTTSQTIPADGAYRYLFIAANVRTTAVTGRTFSFNFFASGNFTFAPFAGISASLGGSGTKTIQPDAFVTTWKTDIVIPGDRAITINSQGTGQFYNITWAEVGNPGNSGFLNNRNALTTITFPVAGTYQVVITGTFPRINNGGDGLNAAKLISIDHWGTNAWTSMDGAFSQCTHVINNAADTPNLTVATSLHQMFSSASLLNEGNWNWNLSNITDISEMFSFASSFDQDISAWNVSNVTNMTGAFTYATSFDQDINNWNVSNVTDMHSMFRGAVSFNRSLDNWNVSNVKQMYAMFSETTSFNQSLTTWNVSQVIDLYAMFENATAFNGDIGNWNFPNVLIMDRMFSGASSFNRDISAWNMSNIVSTRNMFSNATVFNQNIAGWNTGNVTDMSNMFQQANAFNQNIGSWNVSKVIYMDNMFESNTAFNQNLAAWNVSTVASMNGMFDNSALSSTNYDNLLIGWATLPSLQSDLTFGAAGIKYCAGESARTAINASYNWFFNDGGKLCASTPIISSFTPTSAATGNVVTISGANFTGTTTVTFGGTNATSFTVVNATTITATVAAGTSGSVSVTTSAGTDTKTGFTFIAAPTITSFTPTSAASGTTVTITGTNFTGASAVTFGGTPAASFTVVSSSTITAVLANGTSGNVTIFTPGGTVSQSGFVFISPISTIPIVKNGDNNSGNPVVSQPDEFIDIGQTYVGKDITKTFSIENIGATPVTVVSITLDNNNFSIVEQPTTIAAGSFARLTVKLSAEVTGTYGARLTIQYQSGSFEFNVTGEVKDPSITVYNAVTPNGDGVHDFLKIFNIELYPGNTVTIINRLGEAVFKMTDYNNNEPAKRFTGQGNTSSSQNLIDGTYYYIIDIGTSEKITGFLLLQK